MNFVRNHWFGIVTGFMIFVFFSLFILVLLSPREDLQRRGFIPCTEIFIEELLQCEENKVWCLIKSSVRNSWCDMKVVKDGVSMWVKGKQQFPWSNYIFIPDLPPNSDMTEEERAEYFGENHDFKSEMIELKKKSEEIENENQQMQQVESEDRPE